MKLLDLNRDHLCNKLGIRKIPLSYIVRSSVVPDPIRDICPNLPYYKDTDILYDKLIACALHTRPGYAEDNNIFPK